MFIRSFREITVHGDLNDHEKTQNSSREAEAASKTFYAGIYRTQDYSDTPTIIPVTLNNASEASERRRILLPGSDDLNYYIAEINEQGQRITDNSDFGYVPTNRSAAADRQKGRRCQRDNHEQDKDFEGNAVSDQEGLQWNFPVRGQRDLLRRTV